MATHLLENPLAHELATQAYTGIVAVGAQLPASLVNEVCIGAGAVELRLDLLAAYPDVSIDVERTRYQNVPALATLRESDEGGTWSGSTKEKIALLKSVLPYVDGIDVELRSPGLAEAVEMANEWGRIVVASSHHFDGDDPVSFAQLEYRYHVAMEAGADYFKIAATTNEESALAQLCGFMELNASAPIIAVAMGELGSEGRKRLLALGSRATYCYVGESALVPGQLSLSEFVGFQAEHEPTERA